MQRRLHGGIMRATVRGELQRRDIPRSQASSAQFLELPMCTLARSVVQLNANASASLL